MKTTKPRKQPRSVRVDLTHKEACVVAYGLDCWMKRSDLGAYSADDYATARERVTSALARLRSKR